MMKLEVVSLLRNHSVGDVIDVSEEDSKFLLENGICKIKKTKKGE